MKKFNFHNTYEEREQALKTFKSHDSASRSECFDMLWDIIVDQGAGTRKVLEDLGLNDLIGDEEFLNKSSKDAILEIVDRVPSQEIKEYAANFKAEDIAPEADDMAYDMDKTQDANVSDIPDFELPEIYELDGIEIIVSTHGNEISKQSVKLAVANLIKTDELNSDIVDHIAIFEGYIYIKSKNEKQIKSGNYRIAATAVMALKPDGTTSKQFGKHVLEPMKAQDGERPEKKIIEITPADEDRWEEVVKAFDAFKNKLDAQVREFLTDRDKQPENALTLEDAEKAIYGYTVLAGKHAFDIEQTLFDEEDESEQMEEELEEIEVEEPEVEAIEEEIPADEEEDELEKLLAEAE
jgi:hypothetical protein